MKPFLKSHNYASEAIARTKKANVIAVKKVTYIGESKQESFYSYKSKNESMTSEELANDFPLSIGSNKFLVEIDANDF